MYILAKYIYSNTVQTDFLRKTEYDLTQRFINIFFPAIFFSIKELLNVVIV